MKLLKSMMAFVVLSVLTLAGVGVAEASAYTGYNSIGSYYQYGYQGGYTWQSGAAQGGQITLGNPYYYYPSQPRAGGWFGGGSGWITGLRSPFYGCVTPTHYSSFYRPNCGGGGTYVGGSNYALPNRDSSTYRVRFGGGFA